MGCLVLLFNLDVGCVCWSEIGVSMEAHRSWVSLCLLCCYYCWTFNRARAPEEIDWLELDTVNLQYVQYS